VYNFLSLVKYKIIKNPKKRKEYTPVSKNAQKHVELSSNDLGFTLDELQGQGLEFFAREGARILLQVALEEEVSSFLMRGRYERGDEKDGYRNGSRKRVVQCGSGEIELDLPKVVGCSRSFRRKVIEAWQRRSEVILDVIPCLYVEGLSTRDFKRALKPLWGSSGLSKSSISRANRALKESFKVWRKRDLSEEDILFLFLDGYYLGVRQNSREKEGILVAHGVRRDGSRVLLSINLGYRESTESWKTVLYDLEQRGLRRPSLVLIDGSPGLNRALKDVWHDVPFNRCTKHKTANVLSRIPKKRQEEVKRALNKIFHAACLEDALAAAKNFHDRYVKEFPTAVSILADNLSDCLTFYRFPEIHWKRIRTTNVLERAFKEVRRRTNVVGRFPDEMSALSMVFGVLEEDRLKWRGLKIDKDILEAIDIASKTCLCEQIKIEWAEKLVA